MPQQPVHEAQELLALALLRAEKTPEVYRNVLGHLKAARTQLDAVCALLALLPAVVEPKNLGEEIKAYSQYLNAPKDVLDREERLLFDEDLDKARVAMEQAWLACLYSKDVPKEAL